MYYVSIAHTLFERFELFVRVWKNVMNEMTVNFRPRIHRRGVSDFFTRWCCVSILEGNDS